MRNFQPGRVILKSAPTAGLIELFTGSELSNLGILIFVEF